jgi:flavin reductase (DIM6/NTAB) family NADH-FMN oxidoreductase RutF
MQILEFGALPSTHNFIIGEVLRAHVREELTVAGVLKSDRVKAIGRMGAELYCRTQDTFEMKRVVVPPRS